MSSLLLKAGT